MRLKFHRSTKLLAFINDFDFLCAHADAPPPDVHIRWADDDADLLAIDRAAVADGDRSRLAEMKNLVASNTGKIAVALHDGDPVAWFMFMPQVQTSMQWLHLVGDEKSVFGFGAYTLRAWRGRRLTGALTGFAAQHFRELGFRRYCNVAAVKNKSAIRVRARLSDQQIGWIRRVRLPGGLTFVRTDRGRSIGFFKRARPFIYRYEMRDRGVVT